MQFRKAVIGRMRCIFWYSQMDRPEVCRLLRCIFWYSQMDRPEVCRLFREIYSLDGHAEVV